MKDYVHEHFARHHGDMVRPRIVCADGFSLSVQASEEHYCTPRATGADRYDSVEIGFSGRPDGSLYRANILRGGGAGVAGWVPVDRVNRWIAYHGGTQ